MNAAKKREKFEGDLKQLVNAFEKECHDNKRVALRLKISSVLLSATVTVCLGLKFQAATGSIQTALSNIALALSAMITVVAAYEAFFDPRSVWIRETIAYTKLRNLKREFEFWAAGCEGETLESAEAEELENFKRKLDEILIESLKHWMKIRGVPEAESKTDFIASQTAQEEAAARAKA